MILSTLKFIFFFFISEEKEKISEGKEKMSSVVKKEPLEGTIYFFLKETITVFIIAKQNICLSFLIEVKIFFSSNCIFSPQIPSWHSLTFPYPKHQLVFKCRVGLGRLSLHLKGKSCPQMILIPKTSVPPNKWTFYGSYVSSRLIYKVKCQWAPIDNFNC